MVLVAISPKVHNHELASNDWSVKFSETEASTVAGEAVKAATGMSVKT